MEHRIFSKDLELVKKRNGERGRRRWERAGVKFFWRVTLIIFKLKAVRRQFVVSISERKQRELGSLLKIISRQRMKQTRRDPPRL